MRTASPASIHATLFTGPSAINPAHRLPVALRHPIADARFGSVSFTGPDDFFHEAMLACLEETWDQRLGPLVPGLPSFDTVIYGLRPRVTGIILSGNGD